MWPFAPSLLTSHAPSEENTWTVLDAIRLFLFYSTTGVQARRGRPMRFMSLNPHPTTDGRGSKSICRFVGSNAASLGIGPATGAAPLRASGLRWMTRRAGGRARAPIEEPCGGDDGRRSHGQLGFEEPHVLD